MPYICVFNRRFEMKELKNKKPINTGQDNARDYGNDPYFVAKANKSKVFLEKNGFPKELLDKKASKSSLVD